MSDPTWFEHADLMQAALVACGGYIAWTFRRGLSKFEETQNRQISAMVALDKRVTVIETKCENNHKDYPRDGIPH